MKKLEIGKKIIRLDRVNSTNLFAKQLGSYIKPIHEGTIVIAEHQYSGKGRHDKKWESEAGKNISMSILLFPEFLKAGEIFYLSKCMALAIKKCLQSFSIADVKVKWPNDLYAGHKKIAGILIENSWKGDSIQEAIVGIGLNVNQTRFENTERGITSMQLNTGETYKLEKLLKKLIECVEDEYEQLKKGEFETIDKEYVESLYGKGKKLKFTYNGEQLEGTIERVDEGGKLVLQVPGKGMMSFDMDQANFTYEFLQGDE